MGYYITNSSLYLVPVEIRSQNCEVWLGNAYGSSTMLLLQSILIDCFGGLICCAYIYQFYRGVEISHPIFAILFNNVIFSTVLSLASFVTTCLMYAGILSCHFNFTIVSMHLPPSRIRVYSGDILRDSNTLHACFEEMDRLP